MNLAHKNSTRFSKRGGQTEGLVSVVVKSKCSTIMQLDHDQEVYSTPDTLLLRMYKNQWKRFRFQELHIAASF